MESTVGISHTSAPPPYASSLVLQLHFPGSSVYTSGPPPGDTQVPLLLMAEVPSPGLAELEKELGCSVCSQASPSRMLPFLRPLLGTVANDASLELIDLYRAPLPAPHASRLPAHLLRLLLEGMVLRTRVAPATLPQLSPLHLSILSC